MIYNRRHEQNDGSVAGCRGLACTKRDSLQCQKKDHVGQRIVTGHLDTLIK